MPKLTGPFEKFQNLEKISLFGVKSLENFIGNRILYPQTIPLIHQELETDFAILKEALTFNPQLVYDQKNKKIILSKELSERFPPQAKLITIIIDALNLKGVISVYLKDQDRVEQIGSIIIPDSLPDAVCQIDGRQVKLKKGKSLVFPLRDHHLRIKIAHQSEMVVSGGDFGLMIDLRKIK